MRLRAILPICCAAPLRGLCCVVFVAGLGIFAGCQDGYPPKEGESLEPRQMTQAQRIEAINVIGQRAKGGDAWTYAMDDDCIFTVQTQRDGRKSRQHFDLRSFKSELDYDQALEAFEVRLGELSASTHESVSVLKAASWADASFMHGVLLHLEQDCGRMPPAKKENPA